MTYDGPNNGEGLHDTQLDVSTLRTRGYSIISPGDALTAGSYSVSINSGNLNASDTLTVGTSGDEAVYDGSTVSLSSATNVGISGVNTDPQGNEQYRFDVIWIDSSGEVQKTEGTAGTLATLEENNNLTRFERFSQPTPEPGTYPSPIIAAVVVNSSDSSVTTSQLRDYRVPADVSSNSLSGPLTSGSSLTDIASSGLEIASNGLQILSSIWDAGNSEVVADVNNTNTATDTLEANNLDTARSWQSVTRSINTTETNSTDSEIEVRATLEAAADGTRIDARFVTNGVSIDRADELYDDTDQVTLSGTVSPGNDYEIVAFGATADYSITSASEFRP